MQGGILFLDLATQMGWCEGIPGDSAKPVSGTHRLAPPGASPAAIFGGLIDWLATRLMAVRYQMVVYEAPMDPRHMKTNLNTARVLLGLSAVVEGVAYQTGHYRLKEANVHDIRKHLLGHRPAKGEAKAAVMAAVSRAGFDPKDDNEADAIAGWIYSAALLGDARAQVAGTLARSFRG